jgi:hypothetical protein
MLAQGFGKFTPFVRRRLLTCEVRSYGGILTTRFFLGLAETGMFPGSKYKTGSSNIGDADQISRLLSHQLLVQTA